MGDSDLPTDRLIENAIGEEATGCSPGGSGGGYPATMGSTKRSRATGETPGGEMASTAPVPGTTGWAYPVDSGPKLDSDTSSISDDKS